MATGLTREVFEAIKAGHWGDRRAAVGLVDILERVDSSQRALLTHGELDHALAALTESGEISEVEPRTYVALGPSGAAHRPLTKDEYDLAVRKYRDDFADDVVKVFGSQAFQALAGPSFDPDDVAISFAIERVVDRYGGTLGDSVGGLRLNYPVSLPADADRDLLVGEVRESLRSRSLGQRETWLLFSDGSRAQVGGLT